MSMNPSKTDTTLNIDYLKKESLVLEISDLERISIQNHRVWIFITLFSPFVLGILFRFIIWDLYSAFAASIIIFGSIIYNARKVIKNIPKSPYFFDTIAFYPNEIVMKKKRQVKTLKLNPPYLFDLVINQKEERTVVEIENFGVPLLVFN